jgi:hypothetical protein
VSLFEVWAVTSVHVSVAGLGGLGNDDRNAKADLLRSVPHTETKLRNLNFKATRNPAMAHAQCCVPFDSYSLFSLLI